ncbi:thioredoxin family protein [Sulfurospirillum arcachonense]|uniref:thioredoxin family protein n=1 Tax=Sulfurospirillum arcachonense TaxID=57666 RepID=UPI00046A664F|nr:thioredoxin fold domain-containing protein [Sulfurospirillum arcachonense]
MKKILCFCILAVSLAFGTQINWAKDYKSALNQAKSDNKQVLMVVESPNCPYCSLLKEDVLSSSSVANFINKNFVPVLVKQNDGTYPSSTFQVYGTPTTFFVNNNGEESYSPIIGYVEKEKYFKYLGMGLNHQ